MSHPYIFFWIHIRTKITIDHRQHFNFWCYILEYSSWISDNLKNLCTIFSQFCWWFSNNSSILLSLLNDRLNRLNNWLRVQPVCTRQTKYTLYLVWIFSVDYQITITLLLFTVYTYCLQSKHCFYNSALFQWKKKTIIIFVIIFFPILLIRYSLDFHICLRLILRFFFQCTYS